MSKLLKHKKWLTIPEAAERLSTILEDKVAEADVLRLALDGHLRLSVYFVNGTYAKLGRIVGPDELSWKELPGLDGDTLLVPDAHNLDGERFLKLDYDVVQTISGVWDMPLRRNIPESAVSKTITLKLSDGREVTGFNWGWAFRDEDTTALLDGADAEQEYQNLIAGPDVDRVSLEGTLLERSDGTWCQLQTSFDDNQYQAGSRAALEHLKQRIAEDGIDQEEATNLLDKHKEDRKKYLEERETKPRSQDFYPSGGLPDDAMFVIRTEALRDFEQRLADQEEQAEQEPVEDADKKMAAMFDPVRVDDLERLFPTGKWGAWTNNAKRYPALHIARTAPAQWNPYLAAQFLKKKVPNWTEERIIAALKKALPERSEDKEWMLDP